MRALTAARTAAGTAFDLLRDGYEAAPRDATSHCAGHAATWHASPLRPAGRRCRSRAPTTGSRDFMVANGWDCTATPSIAVALQRGRKREAVAPAEVAGPRLVASGL